MDDKALYQQKQQAQLDQWRAEIDKLKAKASRAGADAQLEMNQKIEALESKFEEGRTRLSELAAAGGEKWESAKTRLESTWDVLKSSITDFGKKS